MSNVFGDEGNQPSKPFEDPNNVSIDDIVGEDKKYKSVDDAIRALAHSQNHIVDLEMTQNRMRGEVEKMTTLQELIDKLGNGTPAKSAEEATPAESAEVTEPKPTPSKANEPVDFDKLIEQKYGNLRAQEKAEANTAEVRNKLIETFEDEGTAKAFFTKRLGELNMSAEELDEMASKNPAAALKLLDVPTKSGDTPVKPATFNRPKIAQAPNPDNPQTIEDFNELRRKDLRKWMSPAIQKKLNALVRDN